MPDNQSIPSNLETSTTKTPQGAPPKDRGPPPVDFSLKAYDPSWYTWSRVFHLLMGRSTYQEGDQWQQARSAVKFDEECKECHEMRDWLLRYSPRVRFMAEKISKLGFDVDSTNIIQCTFCDRVDPRHRVGAQFREKVGIVLCQNSLRERGVMEDSITHEMVHLYDYMRFKYDEKSLRHLACTEVCSGISFSSTCL